MSIRWLQGGSARQWRKLHCRIQASYTRPLQRAYLLALCLSSAQCISFSACRTPLRKVAVPEDIASQIVILSSSKVSGHVTGQVIMVEGGMEGRLLNRPEDVGC